MRPSRIGRFFPAKLFRSSSAALPVRHTMTRQKPDLQKIIQQKREQQANSIPPDWRIPHVPVKTFPNALEYIQASPVLSHEEKAITETTDANVLLKQLETGELSSVEVTMAFAKRAALAHQLTNCCTEILFDQALEAARRADAYLARTGKPIGPLHGLPVSLKDSIYVKGVDSTIGWIGRAGHPVAQDGAITQVLQKLGAIVYVKTNIPQSMMMSDSYNNLFGQCVNSINRNFISGGSSGGEGSLVSAQGSVLGIGSDLGGSVRIPASLCGLYGLSPTTARHPYEQGGPRQSVVRSTFGPLASSLSSIETYMRALLQSKPWEVDPGVSPIPWRSELCRTGTRLKIGFVIDDGYVKVQPPVARAMRMVITALKKDGHEVVEWDAKSHAHGNDLWTRGILSDGGEGARRVSDATGEPIIQGQLIGTDKDRLTSGELNALNHEKMKYSAEYLRRWVDSGIDALIIPVTPWAGYLPQTWVKSHQYLGYSSIWNFLDYAALTIPVTQVSVDKDQPDQEWTSHRVRNVSDEFNYGQYDVELVKGHPVGVQVVGGRFGEEKCIAVAKVIESLLGSEYDYRGYHCPSVVDSPWIHI